VKGAEKHIFGKGRKYFGIKLAKEFKGEINLTG